MDRFLILTGHGVDENVIKNCEQHTRQFFDCDVTKKSEILMTDDNPYGKIKLSIIL